MIQINTKIPCFDLGYFGTIDSIKEQILLMGDIIGEESNAQALVKLIDTKIRELQGKLPRRDQPIRVLYYDEGGYVPGASSNFTSICKIIGAVNATMALAPSRTTRFTAASASASERTAAA